MPATEGLNFPPRGQEIVAEALFVAAPLHHDVVDRLERVLLLLPRLHHDVLVSPLRSIPRFFALGLLPSFFLSLPSAS